MDDKMELDFLERRIALLEAQVFGNAEKDADYPKNVKTKKQVMFINVNVACKDQCVDSLAEIHEQVGSALAGKKKAAQLFGKLPELRQYLDHSYTDAMMLSDDARADTILAESDFIEKQASLLEQLSENSTFINSEHVQATPQLSGKLQELSRIHITQQDQVSQLSEETCRLLEAYNNVVSLLSKQFILWDETLSRAEMKKIKK